MPSCRVIYNYLEGVLQVRFEWWPSRLASTNTWCEISRGLNSPHTQRLAINGAFWCLHLNRHHFKSPFHLMSKRMAGFWLEVSLHWISHPYLNASEMPPQASHRAPKWLSLRARVQTLRCSGKDSVFNWAKPAGWLPSLPRAVWFLQAAPSKYQRKFSTFTIWCVLMNHSLKPSPGLNVTHMLIIQATPKTLLQGWIWHHFWDLKFLGKQGFFFFNNF